MPPPPQEDSAQVRRWLRTAVAPLYADLMASAVDCFSNVVLDFAHAYCTADMRERERWLRAHYDRKLDLARKAFQNKLERLVAVAREQREQQRAALAAAVCATPQAHAARVAASAGCMDAAAHAARAQRESAETSETVEREAVAAAAAEAEAREREAEAAAAAHERIAELVAEVRALEEERQGIAARVEQGQESTVRVLAEEQERVRHTVDQVPARSSVRALITRALAHVPCLRCPLQHQRSLAMAQRQLACIRWQYAKIRTLTRGKLQRLAAARAVHALTPGSASVRTPRSFGRPSPRDASSVRSEALSLLPPPAHGASLLLAAPPHARCAPLAADAAAAAATGASVTPSLLQTPRLSLPASALVMSALTPRVQASGAAPFFGSPQLPAAEGAAHSLSQLPEVHGPSVSPPPLPPPLPAADESGAAPGGQRPTSARPAIRVPAPVRLPASVHNDGKDNGEADGGVGGDGDGGGEGAAQRLQSGCAALALPCLLRRACRAVS